MGHHGFVINVTSTGTLSPHGRPLRASIGVSVANMDGLVVVGMPGRSDTCGERHALNVVLNGGAKHLARSCSLTRSPNTQQR